MVINMEKELNNKDNIVIDRCARTTHVKNCPLGKWRTIDAIDWLVLCWQTTSICVFTLTWRMNAIFHSAMKQY